MYNNTSRKVIIMTVVCIVFITMAFSVQAEENSNELANGKKYKNRSEKENIFNKPKDMNKWRINIGLGIGYVSVYEGADEQKSSALPVFGVKWNNTVYFNPKEGLGVYLFRIHGLRISSGIGYKLGRDEDITDDLHGMGDIDDSFLMNFKLEYGKPVSVFVSSSKHIGGSDGVEARFGIKSIVPIGLLTGSKPNDGNSVKGPVLMYGISAEWADDKYMRSYFGISSIQSSRSGLEQYKAKSCFKSVDVNLGLIFPLADKWRVGIRTAYSRIINDAADSPLVKKKDQVSGGVSVSYHL